ncbi:MAG TPA: nuclear transport factor 2 family protein [Terriglobales bacterium]|nr:nuclear transport factor 2 family protein [Terriglobales bacterium]
MPNRILVMLSVCAAGLLCISSQTACAQDVAAQPASSIRQEVIDLQKAFRDAEERGDTEYVKNALADDFTSIETNGGSSGKNEYVRDIHPPERPGPSPILYDFKVIELDQGCVVVTYNAVFPGSQLERYQHLSNTWVKRDGKWRLKFQQSTLNLWSAHDLD